MQHNRYDNPIATLVSYIEENNLDAFTKLFDTLQEQVDLFKFNLYQLHAERTLHQHILKHKRKPFFQFLLEREFSDKPYWQLPEASFSKTIRYLVDLIDSNPTEFIYWFDLLHNNPDLIQVNVDALYQEQTLLQFVQPAFVEKLIAAGYGINIGYDASGKPLEACMKSAIRLSNNHSHQFSEKILIAYLFYGVRTNHQECVKEVLRRNIDVNALNKLNRTALCYASMKPVNFDIIELLLAHGAEPRRALHVAIAQENVGVIEKLLFHGAGLFQNVPESFANMNVNANNCYVEGLSINGVSVTRKTRGFHQALFSIPELVECKNKQDNLSDQGELLPLHSIAACLSTITPDSEQLTSAREMFRHVNRVPSLQVNMRNYLAKNRYNQGFLAEVKENSMESYIKLIPVELRNKIMGNDDERRKAIAILNDRLDELMAFSHYVETTRDKTAKWDSMHRRLADTGSSLTCVADVIYGIHSGFSCCIVGTEKTLCCCSCCCMDSCPTCSIMLGTGLPGFILLGISIIFAAITISYLRQHGKSSFFNASDHANTPACRDKKIEAALVMIANLMSQETLPAHIEAPVAALSDPHITFDALLTHLNAIVEHYNNVELRRVKSGRSQTPLAAFDSRFFFWDDNSRLRNRNNKLPNRLQMMDDEDFNPQTHLGYELFEFIASPELAPAPIAMHEEIDEMNEIDDENVPLIALRW